jgi:hypothetical protein
MPATPHDSTGTTFTFASVGYTVTNIVYTLGEQNNNVQPIDISHLGQTAGQSVLTMDRPLKGSVQNGGTTGRVVDIDYQGSAVIADGSTGTLSVVSGGATIVTGMATVTNSSVTLAVNDIIRGKASFKIAR